LRGVPPLFLDRVRAPLLVARNPPPRSFSPVPFFGKSFALPPLPLVWAALVLLQGTVVPPKVRLGLFCFDRAAKHSFFSSCGPFPFEEYRFFFLFFPLAIHPFSPWCSPEKFLEGGPLLFTIKVHSFRFPIVSRKPHPQNSCALLFHPPSWKKMRFFLSLSSPTQTFPIL